MTVVPAIGDALEERAPRGEELVALTCGGILEPEQMGESGLDPPALVLVGDVVGNRRRELRPGLRAAVGLGDAGAHPHHLA